MANVSKRHYFSRTNDVLHQTTYIPSNTLPQAEIGDRVGCRVSNFYSRSLGNVATQLLSKIGGVIGVDLGIVACARDRDVAEAGVEQVWVDTGVGVNEDPFGGEALGTVTGDGVAVVEMRMRVGVEFDLAAVVEADGQATVGVDRLDRGHVAIGNVE